MEELTFSVIIPVLNEEKNIPARISEIRQACPEAEIIVSDGASSDQSVQVAKDAGVKIVHSKRGRGAQCNAGASASIGLILLFLHADTRLPQNAFDVLRKAFLDSRTQAGTFRLALDLEHRVLNFYSFCSLFDCVFTRFGDQCIVVRRSFFEKIGGFPDLAYFEDVEFLRSARKEARIRLFPATVITSGRRFKKNGILRQYAFDAALMIQYFFGVPARRLAEKYANFNQALAKDV